jgi:heme/copper-type cytochrome/quinol oxidase subunit 3
MPANTPIAVWVLAAFAGSCVGVGFASGYLARHRAWGAWPIGLGSISVALLLLWPVILLVAFFVTSTGHCEPSAGDPCDAPAMMFWIIITVFMPLLFVISFVLALSGGIIAWLRFRP